MGTCQFPNFKILAPFNASRVSSILGRGWASFTVMSLSFRKSMQECYVPSFFFFYHNYWEAHRLEEVLTISCSNMSFSCSCSCLRTSGFCIPYGCLIGGPFVWISCSMTGAFPSLNPFPAKTSLNSVSRASNSFFFSWGQFIWNNR